MAHGLYCGKNYKDLWKHQYEQHKDEELVEMSIPAEPQTQVIKLYSCWGGGQLKPPPGSFFLHNLKSICLRLLKFSDFS